MIGFTPCSLAKLSKRFSEKMFGCDLFPAKSGKKADSIEKETKAPLTVAGTFRLAVTLEATTASKILVEMNDMLCWQFHVC